MKIPILNIYYLLCYAWDKLEEGEKVNISKSSYNSLIELLARVLINGCKYLLKKGIDKNYLPKSEEYNGVKGKINFGDSIKRNSFNQGKAVCEIDEFESNILPNQLIKATLSLLFRCTSIPKDLKAEISFIYSRFSQIDDIQLNALSFQKVHIHRNNTFYNFLLQVCKLIIDNSVLDEEKGEYLFKEFLGNEKQMGALFEAFLKNFYKREQSIFKVKREKIYWNATSSNNSTLDLLPDMNTDVTLISDTKKIIIESKFSPNALVERYGTFKLNSKHLYQLFAYLKNNEPTSEKDNFNEKDIINLNAEGMLVYPTIGVALNEHFILGEHKLSIITIDLGQPWHLIRTNLLAIIDTSSIVSN